MKIAVFRPIHVRNNNAFDSSVIEAFVYLSQEKNWQVDIYVDKDNKYKNTHSGINIIEISSNKIMDQLMRIPRKFIGIVPFPFYSRLKGELKNYDVIIGGDFERSAFNYYVLFPFRSTKKPKLILLQGCTLSHNYKWWELLKLHIVKYILNNLVDGFISPSSLVAKRIRKLGRKTKVNESYFIIGHPVIISNRKKEIYSLVNSKRITLTTISRLVEEKGVYYIIEAIKRLQDSHDVKLVIIGNGPLRRQLEIHVERHGLSDIVEFIGKIDKKNIPNYLINTDIFITFPYSSGKWEEYFGVANIESMSLGVPTITSNCGAIPEVVDDGAVIVLQKRVDLLKNAIEQLFSKERREKLGRCGREVVKKYYTKEIVGEKYYKAIMHVCTLY